MPIAPNIEVSINTSTLGGNTSGVVIDGIDTPAIVQGNLVITGSLTALGPIVISGGAIPITDIAGVPALVPYFDATGFMGTDPTFGFNDITKVLTAQTFSGALFGNADTATNMTYAGLTGVVPTWNQSTTGNAATATLATSANQVVAVQAATLNMGSHLISNIADGLAYTDAVNYGQLTTLAGGIVYLNPTLVSVLISDNLTTPPGAPVAGRGYIAAATGGGWTAGHCYVRDDTNTIWVDLTGAPIQVGAVLGVNMEDMQTPGGGLTGHNHQIATVTGNTPGAFTYSFYTPLQTNATYINGAYIDFGHLYYYNGTVWIDLLGGATLQPGAGVGLAYNGQILNSTGVFGIPISATTGTFTGNVTAPNFIGTASNASQLNGQFAAYYAPISNPSFPTNATFNNGGATSIFVGPGGANAISYYGDGSSAAIRAPGDVYFQNASGSVTYGRITASGFLNGAGNIINSIGTGQTWGPQSRATNTWYTNTTNRSIAVCFFGQNSTTIQDIGIISGGTTVTYIRLTNPHATTASIIIPPGGTYYYQQIGPASGNYYMQELR